MQRRHIRCLRNAQRQCSHGLRDSRTALPPIALHDQCHPLTLFDIIRRIRAALSNMARTVHHGIHLVLHRYAAMLCIPYAAMRHALAARCMVAIHRQHRRRMPMPYAIVRRRAPGESMSEDVRGVILATTIARIARLITVPFAVRSL